MEFIAVLGFFAIIFSLFYLAFHFIKKVKDKERRISKKIFYPTLIGGLVVLILGSFLYDRTFEMQLADSAKQNENLIAENDTLKTEKQELIQNVSDLESDIDEMTTKVSEYEGKIASLEEEKAAFNTEKESLNEEITALTETNNDLKDEVASLEANLESTEAKLASAEANTVGTTQTNSTSSTSGVSDTESTSSDQAASSTNVYYKNCTAARDAGAAPVRVGDPGYASHLDRDGDGVGCE